METISGVASVISVVTLALQSTKVIYEVGSSISHGSNDIDRLFRATGNLEKLLEVIKRLAVHAESTNSVAEGKLLEELTPLVEQCAGALGEVSAKLAQLQRDSSDGRWKKAKKYARVYLDTKGITEIWNTVNHHVELLGSHLGNASVDVGLYNAEKVHLLHNAISAVSRDNKDVFSHIEEVLRDHRTLAQIDFDAVRAELHQGLLDAQVATTSQVQGMIDIKTEQEQLGRAFTVGYEKIADLQEDIHNVSATIHEKGNQTSLQSEAFMTDVRDGISEVTKSASVQSEAVRSMNTEITEKLRSISDRLEAVPDMAREQSSTLQDLVKMISGLQLEMRSGRQAEQSDIRSNFAEIEPSMDSELFDDPEMERLLRRICHFASTMTTYGHSKNAQSVIDDVSCLLGLVMQQYSAMGMSRDQLPRKRKTLCDYHCAELETDVQSMQGLVKAKRLLTASKRVRVYNQDSWQKDEPDKIGSSFSDQSCDRPLNNLLKKMVPIANLQDTARSWALQHGRLDASFKTMLLQGNEDSDTESADEAFAGKVVVTPATKSLSKFQIAVDMASLTKRDQITSFTPTLTFRAMIPCESEVFCVVQRGSVKKLKRLISSGAASLGDCDPEGRSLLNYALSKNRRKMTQFLIQSGADVDTLEIRNDVDLTEAWMRNPVKPLSLLWRRLDCEMADEDLERAEGCYKLLLDAGSDLTSIRLFEPKAGGFWATAFSVALSSSSLVKLKALIDLGEPFTSVESTGDNNTEGTVPLHLLAYSSSQQYGDMCQTPDKVALLLSRGADAKARNTRGETCLHLIFSDHGHTLDQRCWCNSEYNMMEHLSELKDIIILVVSAGADVCAIDELGISVSDAAIDSGKQVLWSEALKYCGIDINDVLAHPNVDPAHSTALSSQCCERPKSVTSKVLLTDYLKRRKPSPKSVWHSLTPQISSSEDDESESENETLTTPSEDEEDESEDETLAKKGSKPTQVRSKESVQASGETSFIREDNVAGRKAKID